jgi:hypothetical protein
VDFSDAAVGAVWSFTAPLTHEVLSFVSRIADCTDRIAQFMFVYAKALLSQSRTS